MENKDKSLENFDQLDENELALVLNQIGRRMLVLRSDVPDSAFWYGVLMRVNKWLATQPFVNDAEKQLLVNPPSNVSGRVRAIKSMRERSGRNMYSCMAVVDKWIKENLDLVHDSVRASYLANDKNRREAGVA